MMLQRQFSALALGILVVQSLVVPSAFADATCTLTALDSVAGLGSHVTAKGCAASQELTLTLTGPTGNTTTQTAMSDAMGSAFLLIPSRATVIAGVYTASIGDAKTRFTVIADRADDTRSILSTSPQSLSAPGNNITVTAVLRDRYQNPVSGRPVALISNRSSDDISPLSESTDDDGQFTWSVRPVEPGTMSLSLYDIASAKQMNVKRDVSIGGTLGGSSLRAALTGFESGGDPVLPEGGALLDGFVIELPQGATSVIANDLFSLTVRAVRGGNTVRSYIGSLVVESSDPDADLPKKGEDPRSPSTGRIDIRNVDQGERKVPLSFLLRQKGTQTITVYDKLDPTIRGQIELTVTKNVKDVGETIVVLDPKDKSRIRGRETILVQGRAPSLINLTVKGGAREVSGESDSEGVFRITVPLDPENKEVTLFVESENGTYESSPVHVFLDSEAPSIASITMSPAEARAKEKATVSVTTEPELESVVAVLKGVSVPLTKAGDGVYNGTVVAPDTAGVYDLSVTAKDSAGNESTTILKWTVRELLLPTVSGVTGEADGDLVRLSWSPVSDPPVTEYKIYISTEEEPTNYLYSIGTGKPVTSATVKDLKPGKRYLFSVTAIGNDGIESKQKSSPLRIALIGLNLTHTVSRNGSLLSWSAIPDTPLSHYLLEYGTEPGVYSEKRNVAENATTFTLKDLLPGITYEARLTPVTVTGKALSEHAAVLRFQLPEGFQVVTSDPAPVPTAEPPLHGAAGREPLIVPRTTPSSGLSSVGIALAAVTAFTILALWWEARRERAMTERFLASLQGPPHPH